jgi:hypothetical protein
MSWRDIEGKRIERVEPVDESEIVLHLEGKKLARIRAVHPPHTPAADASLELELKPASRDQAS